MEDKKGRKLWQPPEVPFNKYNSQYEPFSHATTDNQKNNLELVRDIIEAFTHLWQTQKPDVNRTNSRKHELYVYDEHWDNLKFTISRTHLRVGAVIQGRERRWDVILPANFWRLRDRVLPYGEAFLKGIRLYDYTNVTPYFFANTSNCFHAHTNFTWNTVPSYLDFISRNDSDWWPIIQATSKMTRILAEGLFYCNSMERNAYLYYVKQKVAFGSWLVWSYSFLQNVLSSVISINNIYQSLIIAYERNLNAYIAFDFGRLLRVLFSFEPIELQDPENDWYYNSQTAYYNVD